MEFTVLKRMPFGLKNTGASFQFLVEKALPVAKGGQLDAQNCCLAYLDDIIVPGRSVEENLEYVEIVLKALIKNKLKLHAKKCVLLTRKLEYLGHVISGEGIATSNKKIAKIRDWPRLRCQKDVRAFLGAAQYYSNHIQGCANLAEPLYRLTEKKNVVPVVDSGRRVI